MVLYFLRALTRASFASFQGFLLCGTGYAGSRQRYQDFSWLLIIPLLLVMVPAQAERPSFNCASAGYLDEQAICSNDELSRLDNIANTGYLYVRRTYGRAYASAIDLPLLKARHSCGNRLTCIRAQQLAAIRKFQSLGAPIDSDQPAEANVAASASDAEAPPQQPKKSSPDASAPTDAEPEASGDKAENSEADPRRPASGPTQSAPAQSVETTPKSAAPEDVQGTNGPDDNELSQGEDDQQSLKAATRVLQFAAYTGVLAGGTIEHDSIVQKPTDPAVDLVDFVKISGEPCTYERRDFVPVTANGQFSRPIRGGPGNFHWTGPQMPRDHYAIWHTRIDFRNLSDEWQTRGPFLRIFGRLGICKYETNFRDPSLSLNDVRTIASRSAKIIEGTTVRCTNDIHGAGSYTRIVLRAINYIHSHDCPPYQLGF